MHAIVSLHGLLCHCYQFGRGKLTPNVFLLSQDFLDMLPMPDYCHPDGVLNLASYQKSGIKPDLGAKFYCAGGRWEE